MPSSLSALMDGAKKYSPPVVVTKRCMRVMWSGLPPGRVKVRVAVAWAMRGSWPSPALGKSELPPFRRTGWFR